MSEVYASKESFYVDPTTLTTLSRWQLHLVKALLGLVGFVRMWRCVAHCVTCKRQYLQLLSFTKGLSLHTVFMFYDSFFWQHQIMSGKSSQLPHSCQICANKKRARCSPPYRPGVQLAHMCTLEATSRCCCGAGFSIGHMTKFFKAGSWKKSAPAQTSKTTTPLPDRVGRCWIRVASFTSFTAPRLSF